MEYTILNSNIGYNNNLIVSNPFIFENFIAKFSTLSTTNVSLYLLVVSAGGLFFYATWKGVSKIISLKAKNDECCCGGECSCCCDHQKTELPSKENTARKEKFTIKRFNNLRSDVPLAWGLYFQDGATPSFEGIVDLHNRIMFYLVVILFGVSWVMLSIMWNFNKSENKLVYRYLNHGTLIELIWTVGPALVLVAIAFPSFKLLYLMDEVIDPAMTVKVTGFLLNSSITFYQNLNYGGLKLCILCMNKFYNYNKGIKNNILFKLRSFYTWVKSKNRIGPHDEDVISVIVGSLLGDAYGNKRFVEGTRICFRQSIIHEEYLFWLYQFFNNRGYCSNLEPRIYTRSLNVNGIVKKYYGYEFNTYTFRSFDWIYKMFYKNGKKRIHSNIGNYLTPLALAIWISDDGCWVESGVRISCNAFTLNEVKLLIKILNKNFGLLCNVQNISIPDRYSIYIQSSSRLKLKEIVSPFIHHSMLYKLGL